MEREQLYQLIDLQPEIVERLHKTGKEMDLKQAEPWLERMRIRSKCCIASWNAQGGHMTDTGKSR